MNLPRLTSRLAGFCLFFVLAIWATSQASAYSSYLSTFSNSYPDSTVATASCQLCHQNPTGGNPWNAYGWSIREQIRDNNLSIAAAIIAVESLDADNNGMSNLKEINDNAQPGWAIGNANTIIDRNGVETTGVSAPSIDNLDVIRATNVLMMMQQIKPNQNMVLFVLLTVLVPLTIRYGRRA